VFGLPSGGSGTSQGTLASAGVDLMGARVAGVAAGGLDATVRVMLRPPRPAAALPLLRSRRTGPTHPT
jgi:hypothetical protein